MKSKSHQDTASADGQASSATTEGQSGMEKFRMRVVSPQATEESAPTQSKEKKMNTGNFSRKMMAIGVGVVLVLGLGTGLAAAYFTAGQSVDVVSRENQKTAAEVENAVRVGAVFGVPDEKTFRDETEGVLIAGGLDGEGSHTLIRAGGVSQNVYLTSSVVDLDQFVNHRVQIWGETFQGQKAGWLMDVGRVEVKELSADKPEWYVQLNAE